VLVVREKALRTTSSNDSWWACEGRPIRIRNLVCEILFNILSIVILAVYFNSASKVAAAYAFASSVGKEHAQYDFLLGAPTRCKIEFASASHKTQSHISLNALLRYPLST